MSYNAEEFYKKILMDICSIRSDDDKLRETAYEPQILKFVKSTHVVSEIKSITHAFPVSRISFVDDTSIAVEFNKEFKVIINGITMAPVLIKEDINSEYVADETLEHLDTMADFIRKAFSKTNSANGKKISTEVVKDSLIILIHMEPANIKSTENKAVEASDKS